MQKREFTDLEDIRLLNRGNKILSDLFSKSVHSIRQFSSSEADAKGVYRFLNNDRVSEDDIIMNLSSTCKAASTGKFVVCIQDTTEINLSKHRNRIRKDEFIGTTNQKGEYGLGFLLHPSFVVDAYSGVPYGYADIKVWNRPLKLQNKHERAYSKLPIAEKESYKWIEVSENTKNILSDTVEGIVIVQDREGDIYEQFATIADHKTDLIIRASTNRTLADKSKLFTCLDQTPSLGTYEINVEGCLKTKRTKRVAKLDIRYKPIEITRTDGTSKGVVPSTQLFIIEVKERGYNGTDRICWRLLTTIPIENISIAKMCIEWYSWRWKIEEVFKILKKEGYDIEASELESALAVRKLCLMIMEVVIKLFLMRLAYSEPEQEIRADAVFTTEEQEFLEEQIKQLEGKTERQKNPFKTKTLKRYTWAIAKLGGWKGYESKRIPGLTTLWTGIRYFKIAKQGWDIHRNVSTR